MKWIKNKIDGRLVKSTAEQWKISLLMSSILHRRAIMSSAEDIPYFINRTVYMQHDPFLLHDILPAIKRIFYAQQHKERVFVFGDRDADGITATAALCRGLALEHIMHNWKVPCGEEGYGLTAAAVEECKENNIALIITVDCGISNYSEIALAKKYNIDTIVIDHHNIPHTPPPALAIINPKQEHCRYPHKSLSGCTLVYKCMLAMQCYRGHNEHIIDYAQATKEILRTHDRYLSDRQKKYKYIFDEIAVLAALSTVADMMPLLNENRTIVQHGIGCMHTTKNKGVCALLRKREIAHTDITARMLAFQIVPILNAAGRFGHADIAVRLLLSDSASDVEELADRAISIHQTQKQTVKQGWCMYYQHAKESYELLKQRAVLVSGDKIPTGITGLLANKLLQEFHVATIVISTSTPRITGSIRCGSEQKATEILSLFATFFSNWGGHDRAAGFTLKEDCYERFVHALRNHFLNNTVPVPSSSTIHIDAEIPRALLTHEIFDTNHALEPFGQAFSPIIYFTTEVTVSDMQLLGKDEAHARLLLNTGLLKMPAIFWNCSKYFGRVLKAHNVINIIYNLEHNYFRHTEEKRLSIIDAELYTHLR